MSFLSNLMQGVSAQQANASPYAGSAPALALSAGPSAPSGVTGLVGTGLQAGGALASGIAGMRASEYNANAMKNEQALAANQGNAQAGMIQRQGREALGKQVAAFGAAGVGYSGASRTALDQSLVNSELDVLNTKYKGSIAGYGYGAQAAVDSRTASLQGAQGGLLAGSALLKGLGPYYSLAGS